MVDYWAPSLDEVSEREKDAVIIAVDIPIGFPLSSPRESDVLARNFVGIRRSSVFSAPILAAMEAETYEDAKAVSIERTGKSLSQQSWCLRRAILEVERFAEDPRLREVHPEVSFRELHGEPLPYSKKTWSGFQLRLRLVRDAGLEPPESIESSKAAVDDVRDATVAAWSARRIATGAATSIPDSEWSDWQQRAI